MNNKKHIPACFAEMTVEQMRIDFGYGKFDEPGTERHAFASFWLSVMEAEERDRREAVTLSIAKEANEVAREEARSASRSARWAKIAAIIAAIGAIIANRADIKWLISWVINFIKTS